MGKAKKVFGGSKKKAKTVVVDDSNKKIEETNTQKGMADAEQAKAVEDSATMLSGDGGAMITETNKKKRTLLGE